MSNCSRYFLGWDKPLAELAAEYLLQDKGGSLADFSDTRVIVSSAEGGRLLREQMVRKAAGNYQSILSLEIGTQGALLRDPSLQTASALDSYLAWISVLKSIDMSDYKNLFPKGPEKTDFDWQSAMAKTMSALKSTLVENCYRIYDVSSHAEVIGDEAARWYDLGRLETAYRDLLKKRDLMDAQDAKIHLAENPVLPAGVNKLVLIGLTDPSGFFLKALEALSAKGIEIQVLVYAPESEATLFSDWGAVTDQWAEREVDLNQAGPKNLHLENDPRAQADKMSELVSRYSGSFEKLCIGIADTEQSVFLEDALGRRSVSAYSLVGDSLMQDELPVFLRTLMDLMSTRTYHAVQEFVRCPLVYKYLASKLGMAQEDVFSLVAKIHEDHLPESFNAALKIVGSIEKALLIEIDQMLSRLKKSGLSAGLQSLIAELLKTRYSEADTRVEHFKNVWDKVTESINQIEVAEKSWPGLSLSQWMSVLIESMSSVEEFHRSDDFDIAIKGWLELLWDPAPHLLLGSMNDGAVPESVQGDLFIPDSVKKSLGLSNNTSRHARDAYLLSALLASRKEQGRVDLWVCKLNEKGDPLVPSRLLLQCERELLLPRVQNLFGEVEPDRSSTSWTRAWELAPDMSKTFEKLSPTGMRAYLSCPYRFYLNRKLGLDTYDESKSELSPMDYGNLCHAIFHDFAMDEEAREYADDKSIMKFFEDRLAKRFETTYGKNPPLIITMQMENMRMRFQAAAREQARQYEEGWRILHSEIGFEALGDFAIEGMPIVGFVDRIDRHEESGEVRVIDYKTSDKGDLPEAVHITGCTAAKIEKGVKKYSIIETGKPKKLCWVDMQLPLYVAVARLKYPKTIQCGYFNLPRDTSQARINMWDEFTEELLESALHCASGIVKDVQAAKFGPPMEKAAYPNDPLESLFFRGVRESVQTQAGWYDDEGGAS